MYVLGIDTSARRGGVAVVLDGRILASRRIEAPQGFGDAIFSLIAEVLADAGLALGRIDLFAAAAGPGSFTGVRVGLTAAKALGEARGKPAVGVSNLEALAAATDQRPCAVVLDARRREVYGAVFGEGPEPLIAQTVAPWADFSAHAAGHDPVWVTSDAAIFDPGGAAPLPLGARRLEVVDTAAAVAVLAPQRLVEGVGAPELVEANYIRRSDAERNREGAP